jgi:hypothetical protein
MPACTISATEVRRAAIALLALAALFVSARPAGAAGTQADLRDSLDRAGRTINKAEDALRGKDPARVSLLLRRTDEQLARFQETSGLETLQAALASARAAAREGQWAAAVAAVQRARAVGPGLADFAVTRQAEVAGRAALSAAERQDGPRCLEALDDLERAVLPAVLLSRVREAREAIARGRAVMVRRDMQAGIAEVAAARQALDGLTYAGALSRALFALTIASELLAERASLAARDQIQKGLRDLKLAVEQAPEPRRAALQAARDEAFGLWKRINRPLDGDAAKLAEIARTVESIRSQQAPSGPIAARQEPVTSPEAALPWPFGAPVSE